MSEFSQFVGVGPKTIQTAYVNLALAASATGTGQDGRYWDITLATTLTNYTRCLVLFQGSISDVAGATNAAMYQTTSGRHYIPLARLTSNTNLRISHPNSTNTSELVGMYTVIEWWD